MTTIQQTAQTPAPLESDCKCKRLGDFDGTNHHPLGDKTPPSQGTNTGHGHVWERPDGVKMRCGGPKVCKICSLDLARLQTS